MSVDTKNNGQLIDDKNEENSSVDSRNNGQHIKENNDDGKDVGDAFTYGR